MCWLCLQIAAVKKRLSPNHNRKGFSEESTTPFYHSYCVMRWNDCASEAFKTGLRWQFPLRAALTNIQNLICLYLAASWLNNAAPFYMQKQLQGVSNNEKWIHSTWSHKKKKKEKVLFCINLSQTSPTKSIISSVKSIRHQPTWGGTKGQASRMAYD